jgi:hypothetical protein
MSQMSLTGSASSKISRINSDMERVVTTKTRDAHFFDAKHFVASKSIIYLTLFSFARL